MALWSRSERVRDTKHVGDISVATIVAALIRRGRIVAIPFGDNARYDLVVDLDGALIRVQCKTGRLRRGAIIVPVCCHRRTEAARRAATTVDAFGVYCPETMQVALVPFADVKDCTKEARLRADSPRNGQSRFIRPLTRYLI